MTNTATTLFVLVALGGIMAVTAGPPFYYGNITENADRSVDLSSPDGRYRIRECFVTVRKHLLQFFNIQS